MNEPRTGRAPSNERGEEEFHAYIGMVRDISLLRDSLRKISFILAFVLKFCLEMEVGRVLGEGGFFRVSEITNITLRKTPSLENDATKEGTFTEAPKEESAILKHADSRRQARGSAKPRPRISRSKPRRQPSRPTSHEDVEEEYIQSVVQDREFMQAHCLRAGYDGRYALKTMLKSSRDDPNLFVDTLVDLAMEVHFLNTIRHPNILKMRAISHEPAASMNDTDNTDYRDLDWMQPNAFLILDRIYDTLSARLVKWKATSQNTFAKLFDFYQRREKDFLARRLVVAFDIASAIDHLHEQKYVPISLLFFNFTSIITHSFVVFL